MRGEEKDGFASAFINRRRLIRFAGTEQVIESSIGFRPNLPMIQATDPTEATFTSFAAYRHASASSIPSVKTYITEPIPDRILHGVVYWYKDETGELRRTSKTEGRGVDELRQINEREIRFENCGARLPESE